MFHSIVFQDEITIWWDKEEFSFSKEYKLYLDGKYCGQTKNTHYTFDGLEAERAYQVCVEAYVETELKGKKTVSIQTKKAKTRMDVTKAPYFALGDGTTLNTAALQKALDDCTENEYVFFPKGVFLTGALTVHSDTEIYFAKDAILRGTAEISDYLPKIKSRFEGTEMMCYRSLLNLGELDHNSGYNCKNVAIRGQGAIIGGGRPLATAILESERARLQKFMEENTEYVKSCENNDTIPGRARGRLINMSNCENVIMSGIKMGYGPSWNIHFVYCKDIITYGCEIYSNTLMKENGEMLIERVWNGDGWDPDSSENCVIFDTVFNTGDDCIAIKSGKNPEGNIVNRPTKNVYIFNCTTNGGHSVSIGSEMSGGVENVYIWDSDFRNCYFGAQIKGTRKRGGYVKNVRILDSVIRSFYVRTVTYNDDGEGAKTPPVFSGYYLHNVTLTGTTATQKGDKEYISLQGFDEPEYYVKDVHFNTIYLVGVNGEEVFKKKNVEDVEWENIHYV